MYSRYYRLWKSRFDHSLKSGVSEHAFTIRMWKRQKYFENLHQRSFVIFLSLSGKLIWKMSPAVLGESVGVFVNTLTADGKYPVQGCANLSLPIHMQLCEKRKMFS